MVPGNPNRSRCSGKFVRQGVFTATAPNGQGLLHVAKKKNGIVTHLPIIQNQLFQMPVLSSAHLLPSCLPNPIYIFWGYVYLAPSSDFQGYLPQQKWRHAQKDLIHHNKMVNQKFECTLSQQSLVQMFYKTFISKMHT